jgi:hypothetical protein
MSRRYLRPAAVPVQIADASGGSISGKMKTAGVLLPVCGEDGVGAC